VIKEKMKGGNRMKIRRFLGVMAVAAMICVVSGMAAEAGSLFKDYNAVVVQEFKVTPNTPAPDNAGAQIADAIVYQLRRYSQQYGLFDMVIKEGSAQVPAGKRVLVIKGEVKEYTSPTVGKQIGKSFIPFAGGEVGSAYFAAHYRFVDKATGQVINEQDLRTSSTGRNDTVDYAMQRNAEAAAKYIYKNK
jgi:hypothetical protein